MGLQPKSSHTTYSIWISGRPLYRLLARYTEVWYWFISGSCFFWASFCLHLFSDKDLWGGFGHIEKRKAWKRHPSTETSRLHANHAEEFYCQKIQDTVSPRYKEPLARECDESLEFCLGLYFSIFGSSGEAPERFVDLLKRYFDSCRSILRTMNP